MKDELKQDLDIILSGRTIPISEDRRDNLGIESSNILFRYTFDQLDVPNTYTEIKLKIKENKAAKGIVHGDLIPEALHRLTVILNENEVPFTIVKDPEFKGDIAFILTEQ